MNTPAHLILGAAVFARPGAPWVTIAALAGALAPDLSLYVMAGWHLFWLGTNPNIVFDVLYFSDEWMQVFAVDNSFLLWGVLLGVGLLRKSNWLIAFAGAALLHLALDFPLHHDDARPHFWPLTWWKFESPISYWDRNRFAGIVGPLEMLLSLVCLYILWRRFHAAVPRVILGVAALMQLAPVFIWVFIFIDLSSG